MRFKLSDVHDTDMVIYLLKKTGKGHNIISSADCFLQKGEMGYIFICFFAVKTLKIINIVNILHTNYFPTFFVKFQLLKLFISQCREAVVSPS